MYIWLGIDVDSQLNEIKQEAKRVEREIGFIHSNFTLPLHISLKISFKIDDNLVDKLISDISNFFNTIKPFDIQVEGIEYDQTITWIRMKNNQSLNLIHDELNKFLLEKYDIPLHEYDLDYKFHTTLFMDDDSCKVKKAYDLIKTFEVPLTLRANKFLIGKSKEGKLGTYKVFKEIVRH